MTRVAAALRRRRFSRGSALFLVALGAACGSSPELEEAVESSSQALGSCASRTLRIVDLHADFRDIWAGRETAETGKQADPLATVSVDFGATIVPAQAVGEFVPVAADGSCGARVLASTTSSLLASSVWGTTSSNTGRPVVPRPYNLLVRESISGVVSAAGAIAAGGNVTLSSFSVNGTVKQPVGVIAGGKVVLANGSVQGSVTYGVASTIPGTVTVSGTKTLQPFDVAAAFDKLEGLSNLLGVQAATGSAALSGGTLSLTGTRSGVNVFRVSAETLQQAGSIVLSVPAGAGAIVNVSGPHVAIENKGVTLQGVTAADLLWNLPEAGFVQVRSIGLPGSVFAPGARLSFESGSITGTIVSRSFQSPGSGSLASAPLNVNLLLGSSAPSSVAFRPQQSLIAGCTYEFVIPGTQRLTSSGACLENELRVPFRVRAHPSTPATRELASAQPDPVLRTLGHFEARPGINTLVGDVWSRYESAIGVPRATLVSSGTSRPDPTLPGERLVSYQQYHQGYPVAGFGYLVATRDGIFRSATGKVAANLPSALPSPISAAAALQAALAFAKVPSPPPWVTNPTKYRAPVTTLAWIPQRPNPIVESDYRLLWDVRMAGTGIEEPGAVQIDAGTGAVASSYPGPIRVSFMPPNSTYVRQVDDTVETVFNGTQPFHPAEFRDPGGVLQRTLMNARPGSPGRLATLFQDLPAAGPADLFTRLMAVTPRDIVDATPTTPWLPGDPVEQAMASAQWRLEAANHYLGTLGFSLTDAPWTSVDGTGRQQVIIRYFSPGAGVDSDAMFLVNNSDQDTATILILDGPPAPPVDRFEIPHEFAHILLWNIRRTTGLPQIPNRFEVGGVNEALSDLFAAGSVRSYFGEVPDWACFRIGGICFRNISNPPAPGIVQWPSYYGGPHFQTFPVVGVGACNQTNDMCGVHRNSTVVAFWGYLLAKGSSATPVQNPCGLSIEPLDANADVAFRRVINIGLQAAGTRFASMLLPEPTFANFRDETLNVARNMATTQAAPSDTVRKLELAWSAVGLGRPYMSRPPTASDHDVTPADDSVSVQPWQTFSWPSNGDGMNATTWDFQIADGPFGAAGTRILHEATNLTVTAEVGTTRMNVHALALPFDSSSRFYWRVRPHTTGAWEGCYPVHSFAGTTRPGAITEIEPFFSVAEDGRVHAGEVTFVWNHVEGAQSFKVYAGTQDPNCQSGPGVLEGQSDPAVHSIRLGTFQPEEHYFINVQPIGPRDFAGNVSVGGCFKLEIDTAALRPPNLVAPNDLVGRSYTLAPSPVMLEWDPFDRPANSRIRFFEINEQGFCQTVPARTVTVPFVSGSNCSLCRQSYDADIFQPRNPTGYCWEVTSIAANGRESPPSPSRRFVYVFPRLTKLSPGDQLAFETDGTPTSLGKHSYGTDVVFNWVPDSHALRYVLKIGRWPWNLLKPVDPPNCTFPVGPTIPQPNHNLCDSGPSVVSFRNPVASSGVTVRGDFASKGRYCWVVWPEVGDPDVPGSVDSRQPLVEIFAFRCYTSGPAEPVIEIDNPPVPTEFPRENIRGRVRFPYVPDAQFEVDVSPVADFALSYERCQLEPNASHFADLYDCVVEFDVTPREQTSYEIKARTWASDRHPPVKDASSLVHEKTRTFSTSACGGDGQSCCGNNTCDPPATQLARDVLVCEAGKCTFCGQRNGPCCANGTCPRTTDASCQGGRCVGCGLEGEACCERDIPSCQGDMNCVLDSRTCQRCGHTGQRCCAGTPALGRQNGCRMWHNCPGVCEPCGQPGGNCCLSQDEPCADGSRCRDGHCPGDGGGGGGGGVSCPPGLAACGNSGCVDVTNIPDGHITEGWEEWQRSNPGAPWAICAGNTWFCNPTLDTLPLPPGVPSIIGNGTAGCCPPDAVEISEGGICLD